jgi:hypothetical protein
MAIPSNTAYNTAMNAESKQPRWYVEISGASNTYSSHSLGTMKPYLQKLGGRSEKITPEDGKSDIGKINFSLQDVDDEITSFVRSTNALRYNKVTLYGGYSSLTASQFIQLWAGKIGNVSRPGVEPRYDFSNLDIKTFAKNTIWEDASTGTNYTTSGNPIDIMLERILSTNTAGLSSSTYDLGDGQGLALSSAWVDIPTFEDIRDTYFPSDEMFFRITEAENDAKKFFEDEICKPLGLHLVVQYDGKISLNILNPPAPGTTPTTINETNFEVAGFDLNYPSVKNLIRFEFDYKATGSTQFNTTNFYLDTWSRKNWGEHKPHVIKSRGIHGANSSEGDYNGDELVVRAKDRILRRFSTPQPQISGSVFLKRELSEVGDIVSLTHTKLPDLAKGSIGISGALFEITQKQTDFRNGKLKFTMLGTGYDPEYKYGNISPSSTVATVHSATAVTLHDASGFETGWVIQVETAANTWGSAAIAAIATNKVTLSTSIGTMAAGDIFQIADWTDQTEGQRGIYASICARNPTLHIATGSTVNTVAVNTVFRQPRLAGTTSHYLQ